MQREPSAAEIVLEEPPRRASGSRARAQHETVFALLHEPRLLDARARRLVEGLAVLAAGTILKQHAPAAVSDAFAATRLTGPARQTHGQGLERADVRAVLTRATPIG